jgi:hypothetical protein
VEVWIALAPALFGLIGTLAGGWVAYQSGVLASRRADRQEATKSLIILLESATQDAPDPQHTKAAQTAGASLATFGFEIESILLLLKVASAWADLSPRVASGEVPKNLVIVRGREQMKGPDVKEYYLSGIVAALTWLNAPSRRRQALKEETRTSLQTARRVLNDAEHGLPWTE